VPVPAICRVFHRKRVLNDLRPHSDGAAVHSWRNQAIAQVCAVCSPLHRGRKGGSKIFCACDTQTIEFSILVSPFVCGSKPHGFEFSAQCREYARRWADNLGLPSRIEKRSTAKTRAPTVGPCSVPTPPEQVGCEFALQSSQTVVGVCS